MQQVECMEFALLQRAFLLMLERFLMEVDTEKNLQKLFSSTHREMRAIISAYQQIIKFRKLLPPEVLQVSPEVDKWMTSLMQRMDEMSLELGTRRKG